MDRAIAVQTCCCWYAALNESIEIMHRGAWGGRGVGAHGRANGIKQTRINTLVQSSALSSR
eukprot:4868145-Karenia_brevis.AAC.1